MSTRGRPARTVRRIVVAVAALLAVLVLAAGAAVAFRHELAHRAIAARLTAMGLPDATFEVGEVTTRRIVVSAFRADDALAFDRLAVGYNLAGLIQGRVERADLTGFEADLRRLPLPVRDGGPPGIDLARLPDLSLREARLVAAMAGGEAAATATGALTRAADGSLSIRLRATIAAPLGEAAITFEGATGAAEAAKTTVTGRMTVAAPTLVADGLRLESLDAAAPLALRFGSGGIEVSIRPRILMRARYVAAHGVAEGGPVSVSISGQGSVDIAGEGPARARLDAELRTEILRGGGLVARRGRAILPLRLDWAASDARLELMPGAEIGAERVAAENGSEIRDFRTALGGTVVATAFGRNGLGRSASLRHDLIFTPGPISLSGDPPIRIDAAPVSLIGGMAVGSAYSGRARATAVRVTIGGRTFAATGLVAGLAPDGERRRLAAELEVGSLRDTAADPVVAPLTLRARARQTNDGLTFEADIGSKSVPKLVSVSGAHDPDGRIGHAELSTAGLSFAPGGLQPRSLAPALGAVRNVEGRVAARARLDWAGGRLEGRGRIDLSGVSGATGGGKIAGLSGSVTFDGLFPPSTPPGQMLTIRRIDAGAVLTDARIRFALTKPGRLRIDSAVAALAGGRIDLTAPEVDPIAATARGVLRVAGVRLEELLPLFEPDDITATGRLFGAIPIRMEDGKVSIIGGKIEARGGGKLRIKSERAKRLLRSGGEQVVLMLEALEDFGYERLSVEIDKAPDGTARVLLRTLGRNPAVLKGRPFQINVDLQTDLDKLLDAAMQWYSLSGRALGDIVGAGRRGRTP